MLCGVFPASASGCSIRPSISNFIKTPFTHCQQECSERYRHPNEACIRRFDSPAAVRPVHNHHPQLQRKPVKKSRTSKAIKSSRPKKPSPPRSDASAAIPESVPLRPQSTGQYSTQRESGKSASDWWVVIFTGVLAVATVVQILVYWKQTGIMRGALKETAKAAEAADITAAAARDQVAMAKTAIESAANSAAESAKIASDVLDILARQSAAQEKLASTTERLANRDF